MAASTLSRLRDTCETEASADGNVQHRTAWDQARKSAGAVDSDQMHSESRQKVPRILDLLQPRDVLVLSRTAVEQLFADAEDTRIGRLGAIELSEREQTVLRQLAAGHGERAIAECEHMSLRTVKRTVASLEVKFEAPNRFVMAIRATQLGYFG